MNFDIIIPCHDRILKWNWILHVLFPMQYTFDSLLPRILKRKKNKHCEKSKHAKSKWINVFFVKCKTNICGFIIFNAAHAYIIILQTRLRWDVDNLLIQTPSKRLSWTHFNLYSKKQQTLTHFYEVVVFAVEHVDIVVLYVRRVVDVSLLMRVCDELHDRSNIGRIIQRWEAKRY